MMRRLRRKVVGASSAARLLILLSVLVLFLAAFPQAVATQDPYAFDYSAVLEPPSFQHVLGTDEAGADVFTRIVYGLRLEVAIAIGSVLFASLIAIPLGVLAGYGGGLFGSMLTAASTAILAFPLYLFAVLIVASFGSSLTSLLAVLTLLFIPQIFVVVRAQASALRVMPFVLAAQAVGVREPRVVWHHILPHTLRPLSVITPQLMASAILLEAGLSFLGLGMQPPAITWGTLLFAGKNYSAEAWWYAVSTGLVLTLTAATLIWAGDLIGKSLTNVRY
ncbi:MAG: hypothetical protein DCC49_10745 [Acidobacteria bacterium]|nr:MAG: hypothetical protein DCC49_10745 [Acidobacteriota bacterium]